MKDEHLDEQLAVFCEHRTVRATLIMMWISPQFWWTTHTHRHIGWIADANVGISPNFQIAFDVCVGVTGNLWKNHVRGHPWLQMTDILPFKIFTPLSAHLYLERYFDSNHLGNFFLSQSLSGTSWRPDVPASFFFSDFRKFATWLIHG